MRRRAVWSGLLLVAAAATLTCFIVQSADLPILGRRIAQPEAMHHHRAEIQKEIWVSSNEEARLHYRITAPRSSMTARRTESGSYSLDETLIDIDCYMHDDMTEKGQRVRYMHADTGCYAYRTHTFTAQRVAMSLAELPGHDLPETPPTETFMKGVAKEVVLTLDRSGPHVQARALKATLEGENGFNDL